MKRKSKQEKDERMETRINYFKKKEKKVQELFSCILPNYPLVLFLLKPKEIGVF